MNDCSSVAVYAVMRNKFFNEKLFRFALQENYLLNKCRQKKFAFRSWFSTNIEVNYFKL